MKPFRWIAPLLLALAAALPALPDDKKKDDDAKPEPGDKAGQKTGDKKPTP